MGINNLCRPAYIYVVISLIFLIFYSVALTTGNLVDNTNNWSIIFILFINIVIIFGWTWFLNFLCRKGYETISWILVIVPYIIIVTATIIALATNQIFFVYETTE